MWQKILRRIKKGPIEFAQRIIEKAIIGPIKYKKGQGYNAPKYWHDRFTKYGLSLRGSCNEGLTEEENKKLYANEKRVFDDLVRVKKVNFRQMRVLEIGCGTGYYTEVLRQLGVKKYLGIDITDVLFQKLKKKFPQFKFLRKDITSDKITGKFDLVIMIRVVGNIVEESSLSFAMANVKSCLAPNGLLILSPIYRKSRKHLFYAREWSLWDIKQRFVGYCFTESIPSRNGQIFIIEKSQS